MRKLPGLVVVFVSLVVLAGTVGASASPPSGQFSFTEYGRAQQMADATVAAPSGHDVFSSSYTVAPGGDTGWRTGPGATALAVTRGTLAVEQAEGCAARDVPAGSALVLPPGQFRLHHAGQGPVEFLATFAGLSAGGPAPLVDGPADPAPACPGFTAAAAVPTGVSAANSARGTIPAYPTAPSHGHHGGGDARDPSAPTVLHIEGGKDAFMATYRLEPGFSTGWFEHTEHLVVITRGTWSFYEARDGGCEKVEEYRAGDAWAHGRHPHMGVNEGTEPVELTLFGFNLEHGSPTPVFGSNADHLDFTPLPPADCPRLR